jgi:hypothetical protein
MLLLLHHGWIVGDSYASISHETAVLPIYILGTEFPVDRIIMPSGGEMELDVSFVET